MTMYRGAPALAPTFAAAILAGGASRRFGADKATADFAGAPMIAHVADVLRPGAIAIAVAGPASTAALVSALALSDAEGGVPGPLAGVLAALDWAQGLGADWLVTSPCDVPLLPKDLARKLIAAALAANAPAAYAVTPQGAHPLCAAWRPSLNDQLRKFFAAGLHPPVRNLAPDAAAVLFEDEIAFANVNTQADRDRAAAHLANRN